MNLKFVEEISEELFFVVWAVWQYLRLFLFIKKQRLAQASAKSLVDLTHVIESEADDKREEIIVFDMKNVEQQRYS